MSLSISQQKAFAISPKVTTPLSMFGSACIIKAVLSEKSKGSNTYQRIMLAMSAVDFLASFAFFLSTWPVPKGSPGVWGAVGNQATCNLQGFFLQFNAAVPLLNGSLAIYYLLLFAQKWSPERIKKVEPLLLGVPLFMATATSIAGFPLKLYNNGLLWCWISPFPLDCKDSFTYGEEGNCIRGDNYWFYRVVFKFGPLWASIVLSTVCMLLVYRAVLNKEKEVDEFQQNGVMLRKQSNRVAWQCFWYLLVFYVTWTPTTIWRLLDTLPATRGNFYFPLIVIIALVLPGQGFLNFLVYSRSRYHKYRREYPRATKFDLFAVVALSWDRHAAKQRALMEMAPKSRGVGQSVPSALTGAKTDMSRMVQNQGEYTHSLSEANSTLSTGMGDVTMTTSEPTTSEPTTSEPATSEPATRKPTTAASEAAAAIEAGECSSTLFFSCNETDSQDMTQS